MVLSRHKREYKSGRRGRVTKITSAVTPKPPTAVVWFYTSLSCIVTVATGETLNIEHIFKGDQPLQV